MQVYSTIRKHFYTRISPSERFWSKVKKTSDCWLWTGCCNPQGYGWFYVTPRQKVKAHRWAYEEATGPIPEGLTLDHLCKVKHCVNPSHLEPVTFGENAHRGETYLNGLRYKRGITHCPLGHPYDLINTRFDSNGHRHCRICDIARKRRARR